MRAPWHLWGIGVVTLVWNGFAAADYVMTQLRYAPYLEQFTAEQRAYFESFPAWVQSTWALAVWGSVTGSLLLLARSRRAATVFGWVLIFMAATFVHNFILADVTMTDIMGQEAVIMTTVIVVVAVALWLYARAMRQRGILS